MSIDFDRENDQSSYLGLGSDDSSEVVLGPFVSDSRSLSRCSPAGRSSVSMAASVPERCRSDQHGPTLANSGNLGRFRIVEMLGEGQHATVYRAYDPVLERDVALKVPRQGVIRSAKGLERFLGEAKALARLRHPQIVPVYEAGCAGDRHYMAMALIEGCSLARRMAEGRSNYTVLPRSSLSLPRHLRMLTAKGSSIVTSSRPTFVSMPKVSSISWILASPIVQIRARFRFLLA